MPMQMAETNQKTKWIRSACLEAGVGSHGTKNATAKATAAAARPKTTKRTRIPLRTGASLLNPPGGRRLRTTVTNHCFPPTRVGYNGRHGPGIYQARKGGLNGYRSELDPGRSGRDSRLGRQRQHRKRQRGRDRLDPDDRRDRRADPLD